MKAEEYAEYLKSPHWLAFRRKARKRACFCCRRPNLRAQHAQLHHWTYARLGAEQIGDVVTLCRRCHKAVHAAVKRGEPLATAHLKVRREFDAARTARDVPSARERSPAAEYTEQRLAWVLSKFTISTGLSVIGVAIGRTPGGGYEVSIATRT